MPAEVRDIETFKNPDIIKFFMQEMEKQSSVKLTGDEKNILLTNHDLAERVFNGGLQNAVIKGKTSITELSALSTDAINSLTYGLTINALNDGAIKASQVGALNNEQLQEFTGLIARGNFTNTLAGDKNFSRVAEILGIDKEQSAELRKSFNKTISAEENRILEHTPIIPPPEHKIPRLKPHPLKSLT